MITSIYYRFPGFSRLVNPEIMFFGLCFFREKLHVGVIRDTERRQRRKAENIYILEKQKDLTKKYKENEAS